jgi:hypothetical protein
LTTVYISFILALVYLEPAQEHAMPDSSMLNLRVETDKLIITE